MPKLSKVGAYQPTITLWNRLEGRPRTADFDRAFRAEVRDALWFVSKQWQMGEFIGDDAGSPVLATTHLETTTLTRYRAGEAPPETLTAEMPLEVTVENRPIAFEHKDKPVALDIRLLMGRQWLKLVAAIDPGLKAEYVTKYGIAKPDPTAASDATVCAHSGAWQQFAAVATRAMDGYLLYLHLKASPTNKAHDEIAGAADPATRTAIDAAATRWIAWYEGLFVQPPFEGLNPSWRPSYLEHQFACSAPKAGAEKVLTATEYHHGHLDWYSLDVDPTSTTLGSAEPQPSDAQGSITRTFVPTSVTFGGMPHPRWWTFEDWNTSLSFVKPDTTDLNKLLLLDFFVLYSNDWFSVPVTLPVGSITDVRGIVVSNVFGERTLVEAAGRGSDQNWQRWSMYNLAIRGTEDVPADVAMVVLPVAPKVQESRPLEEVLLIRDEVANMVWGVEAGVPLPTGRSQPGKETANELYAKLQQLVHAAHPVDPMPYTPTAAVRFELTNHVPEHWIPFVPVHVGGSNREIQLQRAALPRILERDPDVPKKVEPRTSLLREGLDATPRARYFVHEEEVPRAGARVRLSYQRTRWRNGKVLTWLGIRKQIGRGEGHSGLAFDRLTPQRFSEPSV
jgi:hypothetical protein